MTDQPFSPDSFQTFGDLLRYLRRRERLTQLELSIMVGYSEAQMTRLEKNQRRPDPTAVKALFIPALHMVNEPEWVARLLELAQSARQEDAPVPGFAPYKGLLFFDELDTKLFFGREALTSHLEDRICNLAADSSLRFLAVVGASGSGKSSIVRAGLAAALKRNGWDVRILTPGTNPVKALEVQLELHQDIADFDQLLILVDQFEETFTLCHDEAERVSFIERLLNLAQSPSNKITVVIALRADFYSHCAQYPLLRQAVAAEQEYIGQMSREELKRAIEEPAKRGGWEFEAGFVDLLLNEIGADGTSQPEPGALPLLSHALLATWERRRGRLLTSEGYRASGGVRGAIAETAESVFTDQLNQTQQEIARDVFLRLTELGEGTEDTRRRAALNELVRQSAEATQLRTVLNTLAEARLVILNEDSAEVAHEALIREWQRLHEWLTQDREGLLLLRHLTESAYEWEARRRDSAELYRGARLAQAREWISTNEKRLNVSERDFLSASIEQEQHDALEREAQRQRELEAAQKLAETEKAIAEEQTRSANRLQVRNRVISTVGTFAMIMAILAGMFGLRSNQNAIQADTNFKRAEAQRLAAEANKLLLSGGNSELIALLSLRSINTQYTPQGDSALGGAANLNYPRQQFGSPDDNIGPVAYSPDGVYLLVGSADKTARLLDVHTGKELSRFIGHTDTVSCLAFSPNGKYVVTGSADKTARLWEAQTGKEIQQFLGHTDEIASIVFSPDGRYLLTGSSDNTARLWDVETGQEVREFIGHTDKVRSVAFSPDGKQIFTGSWDKTTRMWDTVTGQELRRFMGPSRQVYRVVLSGDGKTLAAGSNDSTIWLWDVQSSRLLHQFSGGTMAFSPDGKTLIASGGNTLLQWDVQTSEELPGAIGYTEVIQSLTFSPDGKSILTVSWDGIARLWEAVPSPELPSFHSPSDVSAVAYSPDGRFALTGGGDGVARLWDAKTGQKLREFIGHSEAINYGLAFSPDGKYVLTGSWDRTMQLWDVMTGMALHKFVTLGPVNDVAFSADGKYVLAASDDGNAWMWDPITGKEILKFPGGSVGIHGIQRAVFSGDSKYVATASADGTARIFDVTTGKELQKVDTGSVVNSVAFSPDGKTILTTSQDHVALLWDIQTGKEVRRFTGHTVVIWTAIFSSDGKYAATASADGTARIWNATTGQEIRRLVATGPLNSLAFSPDSRYLLTSSGDGAAQQWDMDYHTTVTYLCSRLVRDFTEDERVQFDISDQNPTCPTQ